jgi:hypothetical protein
VSKEKDEAFRKILAKSEGLIAPEKQRLERAYNEEEPNLIRLRQDVANAINIERQMGQHLKSLMRKQFDNGAADPEVAVLEHKLEEHRQVKDKLKAQLAERELILQKVYDGKPGVIGALFSEPKNAFAVIVLLVILWVLTKILWLN